MNVATATETITPAIARQYLAHIRHRDPMNRLRVIHLARKMLAKTYKDDTARPIIIDSEGFLVNGRHRLEAVVATGTTQQMLVYHGEPGLLNTTAEVFSSHTYVY